MDKLRPFSVENSSITCKKGKLTRRKGFVPLDLKLNFYLRVWCRTDIDRQKGKLRRANGKKKKSSQGENKEAKKSLTGHLGEILYRKVSALVSTSPPHPLLVTGPLPFLCCSNSDWFTVRKAAIDEVSASLTNYFHQFPFVLTWGTFLNSSFLPSSEGWKHWRIFCRVSQVIVMPGCCFHCTVLTAEETFIYSSSRALDHCVSLIWPCAAVILLLP